VPCHEGVEAAFREMLSRHSKPTADPALLIHAFHTEGRRLRDTPPSKPHRDMLGEGLQRAQDRGGLAMGAADVEGLIVRLGRLPAYPDVPAALAILRAKGFKLAAISNTDDDLIGGRLPSLGVALDAVITAR
jgi:FMN phosphatase YigB (HAD superfamily)